MERFRSFAARSQQVLIVSSLFPQGMSSTPVFLRTFANGMVRAKQSRSQRIVDSRVLPLFLVEALSTSLENCLSVVAGRSISTYNLHCESKGGDSLRHCQLNELLRHANAYSRDVPMLMAGDFNFDLSHGEAAAVLDKVGFINPFATLHQAHDDFSFDLRARSCH